MEYNSGFESLSILDAEEMRILMLAREQEWAEAYVDEFPDCILGQMYLELICREIGLN